VSVCGHSLPRTLVFIGGSHGLKPAEPTYGTSEEATHGEVEEVEPTGLVGRPGWSADGPRAPTTPSFIQETILLSSCPSSGVWLVLSQSGVVFGLHLVRLSLNQHSDIFCDLILGHSVLATCILAQKYILHILEVKCDLVIYLDKDACKKCKLS